jgi:hypothetical protein
VALGDVQALDDDRGRRDGRRGRPRAAVLGLGLLVALRVGHDALDRAALAGVLAGEHDDGVALADLRDLRDAPRGPRGDHHSTSGASDTIFM